MSLFSEYGERYERMKNGNSLEQRFFAGCELVCQPVSFLIFLAIPVLVVLKKCGIDIPGWLDGSVFPILLAAAIGYLTNWIAIEMLFRPYEETRVFPLNLIWKQGLVPRNKKEIAGKLGNTVATQLLPQDKLADELCTMAGELLKDKSVIQQLRSAVQLQVIENKETIVGFLRPKIEEGIIGEIDRLMTVDNIQNFWDEMVQPRLESEETKDKIAAVLVDALQKNAPDIAQVMKPALLQLISKYCYEKGGAMFGAILASAAEGLADVMLSEETISNGINCWISNPDTPPMLRQKLGGIVQFIRDYVKSPEANSDMESFIRQLREKFKDYLDNWLNENLAEMAGKLLNSDDVWAGLAVMLEKNHSSFETFIRTTGMPMIQQKLDIQHRIEEAVDQMDMRQFHRMINSVVAKHLGAIQVLGFILGGIAGSLMLLV